VIIRYSEYVLLKNILLVFWILASVSLLVFSFTQVDLALTFFKFGFWQPIQDSLQHVGFYEHVIGTQIYVGILVLLYVLYFVTLYLATKKKLSRSLLVTIILCVTGILVLSYNAFSYDMFNYIFDAKIFTYYHANPYTHRGLDFPHDPMLGYMRYIERFYPYGPGWLAVTIPLSFIGFQIFIVTFYLFKLLMAVSFLGSIFLIEKIAKKTKIINPLVAVASFALNPLVLIECLVSSHNDIVMIFFVLLALYYAVQEKYPQTILFYIISVLVKFATVFAFPMFFYKYFKKRQTLFFDMLIVIMITAVVLASLRINYQPWYLLYIIPFISFRATKYFYFIPLNIAAFGTLLLYAIYIFYHNVNPDTSRLMGAVQNNFFLAAAGALVLSFLFVHCRNRIKHKV
jgi:hypothetical protein